MKISYYPYAESMLLLGYMSLRLKITGLTHATSKNIQGI